jgi:hypothetical protein
MPSPEKEQPKPTYSELRRKTQLHVSGSQQSILWDFYAINYWELKINILDLMRYMELHPTNQWRIKAHELFVAALQEIGVRKEDGENTPITFEIASLGSLTWTTTTRPRPSPAVSFQSFFDPQVPRM